MHHTLLVVGETAFGFFFLILMPGTGAELRASKNPVASIAKRKRDGYLALVRGETLLSPPNSKIIIIILLELKC